MKGGQVAERDTWIKVLPWSILPETHVKCDVWRANRRLASSMQFPPPVVRIGHGFSEKIA